jgi:aminotransferase
VPLRAPDWRFDRSEFDAAFSRRTKLVVMANPNNPTGKVFTPSELEFIGDTARRHDALVISDEVYEYLILADQARHVSIASLPGMFDHVLTLSSASKTLFCTGWRVGWCVGPADVLQPLGVKSDETYVCAPAPLQYAVADALRLPQEFFLGIRGPFRLKRDRLCSALRSAGLAPLVPDGAYYVLADYRRLGLTTDVEAMNYLIDQVGVGSVPGSAFAAGGRDTGLLRFCFALEDIDLDRGCARLAQLRSPVGRV